MQFLLEAITLSGIGGILGILLGGLIALAVRTALPAVPAVVSPFWVLLGVIISVSVGLFLRLLSRRIARPIWTRSSVCAYE